MYEKPIVSAVGERGISHRVVIAIGARSKERESKESCHTIVHHNLRLGISSDVGVDGAAGFREDSPGPRCRPNAWARRQVNPRRAQEASAFISFARTKPMMRRAWRDSSDGRIRKFDNRRQ